jgi:hypothetical protein
VSQTDKYAQLINLAVDFGNVDLELDSVAFEDTHVDVYTRHNALLQKLTDECRKLAKLAGQVKIVNETANH